MDIVGGTGLGLLTKDLCSRYYYWKYPRIVKMTQIMDKSNICSSFLETALLCIAVY